MVAGYVVQPFCDPGDFCTCRQTEDNGLDGSPSQSQSARQPVIQSVSQSVSLLFIQTFSHSVIQSFKHSATQSLCLCLLHLRVHSFTRSLHRYLTHSSIHSLIHSFTHPLIHSFIHPCIQELIHSCTPPLSSCIHSLAHSLIPETLCILKTLFARPRGQKGLGGPHSLGGNNACRGSFASPECLLAACFRSGRVSERPAVL